jgi:chemotaxis protein methyltransferase CheR
MIADNIYKFFAQIIYKKSGIFYPEKDFYRLDSRLNALVSNFGCADVDELYTKYKSNMTPDMEQILLDLSTNNETYFFRDIKPFTALTNDIIPSLLKDNPSKPIDIWSCASSTGQEPLSILMSIREHCPTVKDAQIRFNATDISTKALAKAKSATYTNLDVQRGLPVNLLMKYFDNNEQDGSWTAKPSIANGVQYGEFNLLTGSFPISKYDVIYCRNVLIYQDAENKDKIMHNLLSALKPNGFLIMGAGESMIGTSVTYTQESLSGMMVFRKEGIVKIAA